MRAFIHVITLEYGSISPKFYLILTLMKIKEPLFYR